MNPEEVAALLHAKGYPVSLGAPQLSWSRGWFLRTWRVTWQEAADGMGRAHEFRSLRGALRFLRSVVVFYQV